jgi:hypothetical protein
MITPNPGRVNSTAREAAHNSLESTPPQSESLALVDGSLLGSPAANTRRSGCTVRNQHARLRRKAYVVAPTGSRCAGGQHAATHVARTRKRGTGEPENRCVSAPRRPALPGDPPSAAAAFSAAGLVVMSHNHTFVYQTRDAATAAQLAIDLANSALNQEPSATPVDGVDFLPTSRCVQYHGITAGGPARYSCYAPADAFTIEAHDTDALGAHEQIAAQYKMLLAS